MYKIKAIAATLHCTKEGAQLKPIYNIRVYDLRGCKKISIHWNIAVFHFLIPYKSQSQSQYIAIYPNISYRWTCIVTRIVSPDFCQRTLLVITHCGCLFFSDISSSFHSQMRIKSIEKTVFVFSSPQCLTTWSGCIILLSLSTASAQWKKKHFGVCVCVCLCGCCVSQIQAITRPV